jgi:hypothetical protein
MIKFTELVDIGELRELCESFTVATGRLWHFLSWTGLLVSIDVIFRFLQPVSVSAFGYQYPG